MDGVGCPDNQRGLFVCSIVAFAIVSIAVMAGSGVAAVLFFSMELDAARYPGSELISAHSNYKSLPYQYRWDQSYQTEDPFPKVFRWYSAAFNLGPESRANRSCSLLEGDARWVSIRRKTNVLLCDTPNGRMIFVTRVTRFR